MKRFNNDYNRSAHPRVIEAIAADDATHAGYGLDECCDHAADLIRRLCDAPHAAVHFSRPEERRRTPRSSRPRFVRTRACCAPIRATSTFTKPGAVEATGHKIQALPSVDGKISADQVREAGEEFRTSCVPGARYRARYGVRVVSDGIRNAGPRSMSSRTCVRLAMSTA